MKDKTNYAPTNFGIKDEIWHFGQILTLSILSKTWEREKQEKQCSVRLKINSHDNYQDDNHDNGEG